MLAIGISGVTDRAVRLVRGHLRFTIVGVWLISSFRPPLLHDNAPLLLLQDGDLMNLGHILKRYAIELIPILGHLHNHEKFLMRNIAWLNF